MSVVNHIWSEDVVNKQQQAAKHTVPAEIDLITQQQ